MITIKELVDKIKNGTATPRECGFVFTLKYCTIPEKELESNELETFFTEEEWQKIEEKSIPVSDEEFLEFLPQFKNLI